MVANEKDSPASVTLLRLIAAVHFLECELPLKGN